MYPSDCWCSYLFGLAHLYVRLMSNDSRPKHTCGEIIIARLQSSSPYSVREWYILYCCNVPVKMLHSAASQTHSVCNVIYYKCFLQPVSSLTTNKYTPGCCRWHALSFFKLFCHGDWYLWIIVCLVCHPQLLQYVQQSSPECISHVRVGLNNPVPCNDADLMTKEDNILRQLERETANETQHHQATKSLPT